MFFPPMDTYPAGLFVIMSNVTIAGAPVSTYDIVIARVDASCCTATPLMTGPDVAIAGRENAQTTPRIIAPILVGAHFTPPAADFL
jgi:hypothetical protein